MKAVHGQSRPGKWTHWSMQNIENRPGRNKRLGTPVIACVISMSRSALIDLTRTEDRSYDNNHFRGDPQQKKRF